MRRALPILGLWCALSVALAAITTRVADWFAMPNELLYERRAISVAQDLSVLPRIRGEFVSTFDQLYPVLVAPAFRWGDMQDSLWAAHALNAWIMASACIPAFLLARRVTAGRWIPYAVALLAVVMPWILFASFLLTEVAAYPAFVWAVLAMQASVAAPSRRHDLLALVALAFAFVGRTQLALLVLLLPVTILAFELGRTRRLRTAARVSVDNHRLLAWVYGVLAAVGVVLAAAGKLPSTLGVYGATIGGTGASVSETIAPGGIGGSLVEHVATFSLGLGILPFVVGAAWLLANLVRPPSGSEVHAFACIGAVTVVALFVQVTIFDLRFGDQFVHDRYLFYLVPLLVLAFFQAIADRRSPRWSLVAPTALVVLGFVFGALPRFTWEQFVTVNSDGPIAALYRPLVDAAGSLTSARVGLALATVALSGLFAAGGALLSRRVLGVLSATFVLVVVPGLTLYMFDRLLGHDGWSDRPLSTSPALAYDWIDRAVGGEHVAIAPYPVSTAFLVNQRVWRDYEFWNKSIDRDVDQPERSYPYTSETFPQIFPRFDPVTGRSNLSPAPYVLQAVQESRFRVAGPVVDFHDSGLMLIEAAQPWRLDWLSRALYPDGWTLPGKAAEIRVFSTPDQRHAVTRTLSLRLRAPDSVASRTVDISSNLGEVRGQATPTQNLHETVRVCVPRGGYADVRVRALGTSAIPADLRGGDQTITRPGGVLVTEVALADETGGACRPLRK